MSNEPAIPTELDAAGWFALLRSERADDHVRQLFETWRRDPGNARSFREIEALWAGLDHVATHPEVVSLRKAGLRRRLPLRASAAAAFAALVLAAVLLPVWSRLFPRSEEIAATTFATRQNEIRTIALEDGSILNLDADSRVTVRFAEGQRDVSLLEGRAAFAVAADKTRPFRVRAAGRTVTALGTVFDVAIRSRRVSVTLAEGRVQVAESGGRTGANASAVTLTPGYRLTSWNDAHWTLAKLDASAALDWRNGRLVFEDESIGDIVEDANGYSRQKIVLADPAIGQARMGAIVRAGDVHTLAKAIEAIGLARIAAVTGEAIILARPKPEAPSQTPNAQNRNFARRQNSA